MLIGITVASNPELANLLPLAFSGQFSTQELSQGENTTRSPDYAVGLRLLGLDSNNQRARLVAEWSLRKGGEDGTEKRRIVRLETATAASEISPDDVAAAYSDLLGQLSDTIARAIADDMSQSGAAQDGI